MTESSESRQQTEDGEGGFDPREFIRPLVAYKWLVLGVAVVVGVSVLFWTLKQPRVFEAVTTIAYDPTPAQPLGSRVEDVGSPTSTFLMTREFFETQNRIIASRTVAERVVRRLGLHRDRAFLEANRRRTRGQSSSDVVTAAAYLQDMLSVEPVKDTRLVNLRVRDTNPQRAKLIADTLADCYIEKTMEDRLGSTVAALEWLSTQLDTIREQLSASELSLHEFKKDNNVLSVSLEDRQNLVSAEMQALNAALTEARMKRINLGARAAQLRAAVTSDPLGASTRAIAENETIATLRATLRSKRAERDGLVVRYGDLHPKIVAVDAEIATLESQVRSESQAMLASAQAELAEAGQIENGLRSALEDANRAGLALNLQEIEYGRLKRERESKAKVYDLLLERTAETDLTRMLRVTHVRLVDPALVPTIPVSPNVSTNIAGGVGAGIALGLLLAFGIARLDRRLRSSEEVERLGATVLGILPSFVPRKSREPQTTGARDLFVLREPKSAAAECIRTVRTNLAFMAAESPIRSLVVTSGSPSEGKTTVCISLAIALAQSGKRVLLVDTDLRRPRIHKAFGLTNTVGATSILVGDATLKDVVQSTDVDTLDVLSSGPIPPNPAELLHSGHFHAVLREMLDTYDRVVFDSPPLGAVIDAAVLAPQLDGAIVAVKAESTTRDSLSSTLRQLRDVGSIVRGVIINDVDLQARTYGYGRGAHYYYYHREGYYGMPEKRASQEPPPPPRSNAN
jgi:succinoglycan biosynthesis transport protein ExoP